MAPTPSPKAKYPGARKPMAGAYTPPRFRLPGLSNMPKKALGRKTGMVPSFKKLAR